MIFRIKILLLAVCMLFPSLGIGRTALNGKNFSLGENELEHISVEHLDEYHIAY